MPCDGNDFGPSTPLGGCSNGAEAIGSQAKEIGQATEVKIPQTDKEEAIGAQEGEGKRQEKNCNPPQVAAQGARFEA